MMEKMIISVLGHLFRLILSSMARFVYMKQNIVIMTYSSKG